MSRVHLVTFSDESMSRSARLCIDSAYQHGVDAHCRFNPGNIAHWEPTSDAVKKHSALFTQPSDARRAFAFWAWKPLIVEGVMRSLSDGDILIYADVGVEFINNVNYIIDRMDRDIFLFGNNWEHAHWCKGDIVYTCWPDNYGGEAGSVANVWGRYGKQCQASVILFRVSDYSRQLVAEWLKWCLFEDGRLIDDSPSRFNNHPEFRENRHDQAILTTLAYREGIKLHYWPASYNDGAFSYEKLPEYAGDDYPILFNHHRRRNREFQENTV